MRVGLSLLWEHKFKHSFQDTVNPIYNCGKDIETSSHYLLYYPDNLQERMTLSKAVRCIAPNILDLNYTLVTEILLYDKENLDDINNSSILVATIKYLLET